MTIEHLIYKLVQYPPQSEIDIISGGELFSITGVSMNNNSSHVTIDLQFETSLEYTQSSTCEEPSEADLKALNYDTKRT